MTHISAVASHTTRRTIRTTLAGALVASAGATGTKQAYYFKYVPEPARRA